MHGSIRNELENLLKSNADATPVIQHLADCDECKGELAAMRSQNKLFRSLKSNEDVEPQPGFYARVMQRIEEKAKDSIWAVFVYSPCGKRLALASLSIALILGSYVIAEERMDGHMMTTSVAAEQTHYDAPMVGSQAQQRDAVLENFAAHSVDAKFKY
jgi:predicted anti-sigma-YlaC factor YlaD